MPIYEYRCRNGHTFEVLRSMSDDPVATCEQCGAAVERVFHPIAVHFKGSGFYTTDYAKKGAAKTDGAGESKSDPAKSDPVKSESANSDSSSKSESDSSSKSKSPSSEKSKSSKSSD